MSNIQRSSVGKDEKVIAQGSNSKVKIDGDVWGTVTCQGSNAVIVIGGFIHPGAKVLAQGSNAKIKYHGKAHSARVIVQGSNAQEIDLGFRGGHKDPPDQERWVDTALGKKFQVQKSARPRELWGT